MLSTGPKSQRGKTVSGRNAETHGILSDEAVVPEIGEVYKERELHRVGAIESLDAEGHISSERHFSGQNLRPATLPPVGSSRPIAQEFTLRWARNRWA
jgi:hypothetical protein